MLPSRKKKNTISELAARLGLSGNDLKILQKQEAVVNENLKSLEQVGLGHIYFLFRFSDLSARGTSLIAPVAKGKDTRVAAEELKSVISQLDSEIIRKIHIENGVILGAGNKSQLQHLMELQPDASRPLDSAWEALGSGALGLIVFGDTDSRRVLRELLPHLPAPLDAISGEMVANDVRWAGFELKLPRNPSIQFEIACSNQETAKQIAKSLEAGTTLLSQQPYSRVAVPEKMVEALLAALKPRFDESRMVVGLKASTEDLQVIGKVLAKPISEAQDAARQKTELNNIRQLSLAILNYESAFQRLPNPSGKTKLTPAGLSWRVQVLTFIDHELYKSFHLDEPWDSEHNLTLVTKMPEIFKSPLLPNSKIHDEGKTIYQVPVAAGAIFETDPEDINPAVMRRFLDGTSNTIMVVTTTEENAVIWTKPDDWNVDWDDPWKGLKNSERKSVAIGWGDTAAQFLTFDVRAEVLKALLTAGGGEVVQIPGK